MFKNEIKEEILLYSKILKYLDSVDLESNGSINIVRSNNRVQYFRTFYDKDSKNIIKQYIPINEIESIKIEARKPYLRRVKVLAEKRLKLLTSLNNLYETDIHDIYDNLAKDRKDLFSPIILSYSQMVERWRQIPYNRKEIFKGDDTYNTKNGEDVRSKSELFIADRLYDNNIAYKYECPLTLNNGLVIYPDFTLLGKDGKEIYWEHLGRMDDPDYSAKTKKKIESLAESGIFLGERLIITMEVYKNGLNVRHVDCLIEKYLSDLRL